jgi:hypothetical protein
MNGDADLGRPMLILARAHPPSRARSPVTDDLLLAPDGGLNAAPFVVAGPILPFSAMPWRWRSRWVGSLAAVELGTAVAPGGTMTAASG